LAPRFSDIVDLGPKELELPDYPRVLPLLAS
jgi:hypothetical protein